MGRLLKRISMFAIVLLFGVSLAWAQQEQPQQQTSPDQQSGQQPNGQNTGSTTAPSSQEQTGTQQPSTQQNQATSPVSSTPSLTGAEQYTLSRMGAGRSYVIPSFQFAQSVSTSGTGPFGTSSVEPVSTLSGLLAFHHVWKRYEFTAQYAGTGFIYNQDSNLNTSAHNLSLSQYIQGRRSSFRLTDLVIYLPESSFGYARFSGTNTQGIGYATGGLYGANSATLDTTFLPGQTVLTGPSSQIGNSVVGEYDYETSPLSTLTITGSYVLLRFPNSQFISNDEGIFRIGYDHTFTQKDSIALSYQAGIFRFGQSGTDFTNHVVSLTYRRTITERLAFQIGAGPQINIFNSSAPGQQDQVSWQASGLLNYRLRRTTLGLNYLHYTSAGSGVYSGARTDDVHVYFSLPITRTWLVNTSLGYAYNTTVQNANLAGVGNSYNSWYGSINVQRNLSRWMSMFFGYSVQQQLAGGTTCVGSTCGTFYTQQYFSFGLNWHPSQLSNAYREYQR